MFYLRIFNREKLHVIKIGGKHYKILLSWKFLVPNEQHTWRFFIHCSLIVKFIWVYVGFIAAVPQVSTGCVMKPSNIIKQTVENHSILVLLGVELMLGVKISQSNNLLPPFGNLEKGYTFILL